MRAAVFPAGPAAIPNAAENLLTTKRATVEKPVARSFALSYAAFGGMKLVGNVFPLRKVFAVQ